jgi:hypothetical protein
LREDDRDAINNVFAATEELHFQAARIATNIQTLTATLLVLAFAVAVYLSLPGRGTDASR